MTAWQQFCDNQGRGGGGGKTVPKDLKPGFHMVVTVVKIDDLSHQSKYNILELKIRGVIITREYL